MDNNKDHHMLNQIHIEEAWKRLHQQWEDVTEHWEDAVSRDFEKQYIEPLAIQIRSTLKELDQLTDMIEQARRDIP